MRSVKPSKASLRSKDAFTLRRSQILLASSRGEHAPRIAHSLGCGQQTVRDAIHEFNYRGAWGCSRGQVLAPQKNPRGLRPRTEQRRGS
ncbi:MAG TPA: helix-turn-helix domain-containing protein [Rubrobacter sp.]|nr:helix-turn-helix domain-containing protein [Rubrobacter sp.]